MFNSVQGEGIKKFFKKRKSRKLSFASQEPVKVQAGAQIAEIATGAVSKRTENLIISSLKAKIKDLETQLAAGRNPRLEADLAWAKDYLNKFETAVEKVKAATQKAQQPKKEHELKTLLASIKLQGERVFKSVSNFTYTIVKDDIDCIKNEIATINEQLRIYEQSVKSYIAKGGTEEYYKVVIEPKRIKVIYKQIAKKIEELKDELKNKPTEYELKQNIAMLEKLADDLVKFAPTPEVYNNIRTEVDEEIAASRKPLPAPPAAPPQPGPGPVTPPPRPSYQGEIAAYEEELGKINEYVIEFNKLIVRTEQLAVESLLTPEMIEEYISIEEKMKDLSHKIESSKINLAQISKSVRDNHKLDIAKLTSIQAIKVEKLQYKMPHQLYVECLDRKGLDVIDQIKDLALQKTTAEKEELFEINTKIAKLYQFLLSINSLIDRRLVQYSRINRKSITSLYKERHDRRKKIADEHTLGMTEDISEITTDIAVFKAKIIEVRTKWLEAYNKAPISVAGKVALDETPFIQEMTELIATAQKNDQLEVIIESSNEFNKIRTQILKDKLAALHKLESVVRTRLESIYRTGTISETVKEGIDHNEWLTEIEYSELELLASDPEYKNLVPNAMELIDHYIAEQEKKHQDVKRRIKFDKVEALSEEFALLTEKTATIPMDEHFEENVTALFESMKMRYRVLKDFNYTLDLKANTVKVSYNATKYNYSTGSYHMELETFEHVVLNKVKMQEYRESRNIVEPATPATFPPLEPPKSGAPEEEEGLHKPKIVVEGENPTDIKVTNRTIQLATNRRQVINRAKGLIIANADSLTVSLIKQGLRIRYNEHLRDQLKALNAKLSLVNKSNYRSRKDIKFKGEETEQDLAFKTKKENFNIEDYKLEVRLMNDEKKRSDLLYSFDLENISDELHGRTK